MRTFPKNAKPDQLDKMLGCLGELKDWASPENISLSEKRAECNEATKQHHEQTEKCHHLQIEYEMAACIYHHELITTRSFYNTCRSSREAELEQVHAAVRVTEAGRKAEFTSASHIKCLLDVFDADPENKQQSYLRCSRETWSTSKFDIVYHDSLSASDLHPDPIVPCSTEWLYDKYESKPWYAEAPTKLCIACPHTGINGFTPDTAPNTAHPHQHPPW